MTPAQAVGNAIRGRGPGSPTAFDSETWPIHPGRLAPPVVCYQWMTRGDAEPSLVGAADVGGRAGLIETARWILSRRLIVGHNVSYDLAVMGANFPELLPEIFRALSENRVTDTLVREKLIRIADGNRDDRYSLVDVCRHYKIEHEYKTSEGGKKEEYWRTRYAEIEHLPAASWPEDARRYALADGRNTLAVYETQERFATWLLDEYRQTRAAFALHLMSCYGIRTDPEAVEAFIERTEKEIEADKWTLQQAGLVRFDGSKNTTKAKERMSAIHKTAGTEPKLTDTGNISLDADACNESGDEVLEAYARYTSSGTTLGRAKRLRWGTRIPLQPSFNVLVDTGRTSCRAGDIKPGKPLSTVGSQIQNVRRAKGLRECYVPRAGMLLYADDYGAAEMGTLAQCLVEMFGRSVMADMINAGMDLHLAFAATLLGISYATAKERLAAGDPVVKSMRQLAKPFNFGLPGGMGAAKFLIFARQSYGTPALERQLPGYQPTAVDLLDLPTVNQYKHQWMRQYPEMKLYFKEVGQEVDSGDPLIQPMSLRFRSGKTPYCARCNSRFQSRAADMGKEAAWLWAERIYVGDLRGLGIRSQAFIHDEILGEAPEAHAHTAAVELARTMEEVARRWCPDVKIYSEPTLMRRWSKAAGPALRDGRLIPYEDATKAERGAYTREAVGLAA